MITLVSTAIVLISLTGSANITSSGSAGMQWPAEVPSSNKSADEEMVSLLTQIKRSSRGPSSWERAAATVFVVPGPDLPAEGMTRITEDMAIMCRIFDKAMVWSYRATAGEIAAAVPFDASGIAIAEDRFWTQGLYLDGHGAIFFVPVDFPLSAPQEEPAPEKSEPSADPLWSQTADELHGVPQERPDGDAPRYDAQKVENLKSALLAVLRHAANLRTRGPQDAVTVVVISQTGQSHRFQWAFGAKPPEYRKRSDAGVQQQAVAAADSTQDLPTMLILRATKADVDALAKGGLTAEQFAEKVQFLKSWTILTRETMPAGVQRWNVLMPKRGVR